MAHSKIDLGSLIMKLDTGMVFAGAVIGVDAKRSEFTLDRNPFRYSPLFGKTYTLSYIKPGRLSLRPIEIELLQ